MNKKLLIPLFIFFTGCAIITEPEISDSEVFLFAPTDNLVTDVAYQTFWWDYVADAEKYNVIIVSPSWDSIVTLIADTNVSGNKFSITLAPGEYDWAVSAYNYSSSTDYFIRHLTVESTTDLTNQKVRLVSPENNSYTNLQDIVLSWEKISYATKYNISIKHDDWDGDLAVPSETTSDGTISFILDEGVYAWGVQAENDESITNSFSTRIINVDRTAPGVPEYTNPSFSGDTISSDNSRIAWTHPVSSLAPINDSVFISNDSTDFIGQIKESVKVSSNYFNLDNYSSGFYYVKVKSFDEAGNQGNSTAITKFYFDER